MDASTTNSFNMTSKSDYSGTHYEDSSTSLNKNVQFSQLEISEITSHESSILANTSSQKLSITMDTREHQLLRPGDKQAEMPGANGLTMTISERGTLSCCSIPETSTLFSSDTAQVIEDATMEDQEQSSVLDEQAITIQKTQLTIDNTETTGSNMAEANTRALASENVYFQESLVELGRRLWPSNSKAQQYTKGCLWSPDGTCALVPVHLDGMHVVELPADLYQVNSVPLERKVSNLPTAVHVKEGGTVYDYCWYPFMNSNAPETCCWLASRQHEPIHMWDAFDGALRCTYRGYDDVDEVEPAISVIFSNDGESVYAGYKKSIKIFDTKIPGRDYNSIPVKQAISCFAANSDNNSTLTAGSWSGTIKHYDLRAPKLGALFTLMGHKGGITWLRYAPSASNDLMLFSGARKDDKILQWDMRNYTQPLREFKRNVETNQRIYFDLSPQCEWLVSGDTQGFLRIWNLCGEKEAIEVPLHLDCCNGISFHPTMPVLATTSGQYHFMNSSAADDNSSTETTVEYENSLLFLWIGAIDSRNVIKISGS